MSKRRLQKFCLQGCLFAALIRPPRLPKYHHEDEQGSIIHDNEKYSDHVLLDDSAEQRTSSHSVMSDFFMFIKPLLHWRAGALVTGNFFWGSAMSMFFVLFPDYAGASGLSSKQVSTILLIAGASGTTTRVACAFLGKII